MSDTGRPTDYTEEIANKICDLFAMGKSMRQVCLEDGMPVPSTIYLWLSKHREFSDKYVCAKADGQECLVDELSEIVKPRLSNFFLKCSTVRLSLSSLFEMLTPWSNVNAPG